ncbi:MAG: hypothetical protein KAH20_09550 [Methylococcales bacterium]|nr:hypothetical protein [Methylococcales bacterium]
MYKKLSLFLKLLLTLSTVINSLNSAYACDPVPSAKPASIAEKAHSSSYVFDGVITEITKTHIKVRVNQYFKGKGGNEVIISEHQQTSCDDQFTLNQRALFFTTGDIDKQLDAVYDGAFGSVRKMHPETFGEITATTECMANYEENVLNIPCVIHRETNKVYQATLASRSTKGNLTFSVNSIQEKTDQPEVKCMATYKAGQLNIPCVAHKETTKVYQVMLEPKSSTDNLQFSLNQVEQVTNIKINTDIVTENFDAGKVGTVPNGWQAGMTGTGVFDWKLEKDSTAPSGSLVLNQSGDGNFPWCVKKGSNLTNGFVAVKIKPVSGNVDRTVLWL